MGNFYTNFTLKTSDAAAVVAALKSASRSALIAPAKGGYVVVFDHACDEQDTRIIERVGTLLSNRLQCPVLAVLNHDDDILCYWLYNGGKQIDMYNSCPDYFDPGAGTDRGGDVDLLCNTLGIPQATAKVKNILEDDEYTFALERHAALVEALRLPESAVCCSYSYIEQGEPPEGISEDELLRSP
jgi:hypothetical protein